jgi:S1-C subfamily serine protease
MATHGRSGPQRWATGGIAEHVPQDTTLPLLIIRPSSAPYKTHDATLSCTRPLPERLGDALAGRGVWLSLPHRILWSTVPHTTHPKPAADTPPPVQRYKDGIARSGITMADTTGPQTQQAALAAFSDDLAAIVAKAARSVVTVAARPRQSASGILWRTDNETIVLTADHVVEREDDITVRFPDGREVKAQLIGRDPSSDLAALRLPSADLGADAAPAELSDGLRVGNLVLAVGRPTTGGPRVSFGAVSTIDGPQRSWQGGEIEGIIYADVTLYPGFSGGPMVDLSGRVVGMSSSHLTRESGTALPIQTLQRVANTLLTHGRVRRGYLGVGTQQVPLPAALTQKAALAQDAGLLVISVEPGSPAEAGGLLVGDILVAIGGQSLTDVEALRGQLGSDRLGQALAVKVLRGGEPRDLTVTVGERA